MDAVVRKLVAVAAGPESAHEVALGVGIGVAVAFTPTMGGQMAIAGALAGLCGGSVRSALPMVWITNPLTAGPIYFGVYHVGRWLGGEALDGLLGLAGALLLGGVVVGAALGAASYIGVRSAAQWWGFGRAQPAEATGT